jgi:hypothetical protein
MIMEGPRTCLRLLRLVVPLASQLQTAISLSDIANFMTTLSGARNTSNAPILGSAQIVEAVTTLRLAGMNGRPKLFPHPLESQPSCPFAKTLEVETERKGGSEAPPH